MDAMPAAETPEREAEETFRAIACDLDDLRSLLEFVTYSGDIPDKVSSALRPIGAALEQISNRAEAHAEVWHDKAREMVTSR